MNESEQCFHRQESAAMSLHLSHSNHASGPQRPLRQMLSIVFVLWLFAFLIPTPVQAALLGHEVDEHWNITVSVDPVGDNARTKAIGVMPDPDQSHITNYQFQAQGEVKVSITAGYDGAGIGEPTIVVTPIQVGLTFESEADAVDVASTSFSAESFYSSQSPGYYKSWYLNLKLYVYDPILGVSDEVEIIINFQIAKFRHVWATYNYWDMFGTVHMYDITLIPNGGDFDITRTTVTGASVELSALPPAKLSPESGVTYDYNGAWGGVNFALSYPLEQFLGAPKIPVPIIVTSAGYPPVQLIVDMYYAQIVGVETWGGVEFKDPLTGTLSPLTQGRFVAEGNQIILTPIVVNEQLVYPWVRAVFADRTMHELALQAYDPEKMGPTIVTFGNDGLSGQQIAWTVKFTNLAKDMQLNWRDYASEFIWDTLIEQGIGYATQGTGWLVQKGAEAAGKYVVRKGREYASDSSNKMSQFGDSASSSGVIDLYSEEDSIGTMAPSGAVSSGYLGFDQSVRTADAVISLTGAGTLRAENRFGSLEVLDLNLNQSTLLGPGSMVDVDETGISEIGLLEPPNSELYDPLIISVPKPTNLSPLITLTYDNSWAKFKPESLICRVNGVLVTSYASISPQQATVQVGKRARLKAGQNIITAAIWEAWSGWNSTSLSFWASGGEPAPPAGLTGIPGRGSMILTWITGESYIDGYNVYKGSTADTINTKINTEPVLLPAYPILAVEDPGLAAGYWYAVRTVSGGVESDLSEPVQAVLNAGASQTPPAQVAELSAEPGDGAINVSFTPPAGALCYILERQRGGGAYQTVPADGEYLCDSNYPDRDLDNGVAYRYRITPIGYDLIAGVPRESASTVPVNGPPAAPIGLSAIPSTNGRFWNLAWNPQMESDLAGYNVYQAVMGGQFVKVNEAPLTVENKTMVLFQPGLTLWRITAVDNSGLESSASATLLGGYAVDEAPPTGGVGQCMTFPVRSKDGKVVIISIKK